MAFSVDYLKLVALAGPGIAGRISLSHRSHLARSTSVFTYYHFGVQYAVRHDVMRRFLYADALT